MTENEYHYQLMEESYAKFAEEFPPSSSVDNWDPFIYKSGWTEGYQAGLAYAISIAERQGRGWGIQHAEEIRKHDIGRKETSK